MSFVNAGFEYILFNNFILDNQSILFLYIFISREIIFFSLFKFKSGNEMFCTVSNNIRIKEEIPSIVDIVNDVRLKLVLALIDILGEDITSCHFGEEFSKIMCSRK